MSKKTVTKANKMNTAPDSKEPVTKTEGKGAPLNTRVRELRRLPLMKITNRFDWNTRSKAAVLANDGPGEGQFGVGSFVKEDDDKEGIKKGDPADGMVKMLFTDGQTTPIDVYADPKRPGFFLIIDGATRFEAAVMLDKHGFSIPRAEKGTIEAWFYPNMTDEDAEDINLLSNINRRDLKVADLAFGIARSGKRLSDTKIGAMLGLDQSYVSKLHRIVKNAPAIAKQWRDTNLSIHYDNVSAIAALPVDERQDAWNELVKSKTPEEGGGDKGAGGKNEWVKKSLEKATAAGKTLGILDGHDVIDATKANFDASLNDVAEAFGIKLKGPGKDGKDATKAQRGKIATALQEAYDLARAKIAKEVEAEVTAEKAGQVGVTPDMIAPAN